MARQARQDLKRFLPGIGLTVLLLAAAAAAYIWWPQGPPALDALAGANRGYDVRILRDSWGVPHIFGKTDADCAFGLAYAHAEDDFLTIQQSLLAARGQLATVYGPDAAPNDYMVQLLRVWDTVNSRYDKDLSPEAQAMCEAYAAGLNYYASLHPDEALPGAFPVTGKDVVAGSVHKSPLFFGLDKTLASLFDPERDVEISGRSSGVLGNYTEAFGSNTFSVSPLRSSDGQTYLNVNSHQPWEGPVTWYEAHLHSEEGLDVAGALFPGVPCIVHGHNRNVGWAFTVNSPDLIDVYALEMNPDNPNEYLFDGRRRELEVRQVPIKVKLTGRLVITVKREALWCAYGPAIRNGDKVYAIRYGNMDRAGIYEELYRMNKATNFEEWLAAVKTRGLPCFNIGYADKDGDIYYLYNGALPVRSERYDWSLDLPGNTSETLWTEYVPLEALPQVLNPASGFVQNCNSTPYQTTLGPDNPRPEDFSPTLGVQTNMTNRALRALELLGGDPSITPEEFYAYKYDLAYSAASPVAALARRIGDVARSDMVGLEAVGVSAEDLREAAELIGRWDLRADTGNTAAAVAILTLQPLAKKEAQDEEVTDQEIVDSLAAAVKTLEEHFGRIDPPWGEVNRLRRGAVDLPLAGGPDTLRAIYGKPDEDGRLRGVQGDSYVMIVTWDKDGRVSSKSIHQYGSATLDEASPHYADQAPLFSRMEMKPVWLDEAEIRAHLEREYRPGEETAAG